MRWDKHKAFIPSFVFKVTKEYFVQESHQYQVGVAKQVYQNFAKTLREAMNENSNHVSLQEEEHVQQAQWGWHRAILKVSNRKEVPSALEEPSQLKDEAQEGVTNNPDSIVQPPTQLHCRMQAQNNA